jgi:glc operon protein GlcG
MTMKMKMKILIYALLGGPLALPVLCGPTIADRPTITTEGAKLLIEKAEAKARSLGRAVNIAVVDSGGNLLAFERMDGAFLAGVDLCQGKARSALRFEEPTAKIEATIHDGRYALMTAGAIEMQGGIPILRGGSIIGAIGVSGADSSTDVPIAESAVTDLE